MKIVGTKDLETLKAKSKALVDSSAEAFRLNYITPGDGQAMAYREKFIEACLYLEDNLVPDVEIPHIIAEIGITGQDKFQVAQVIVNMHNQWKHISASIEQMRLTAKAAIDSASNPAEIDQQANVDWNQIVQQLLNP